MMLTCKVKLVKKLVSVCLWASFINALLVLSAKTMLLNSGFLINVAFLTGIRNLPLNKINIKNLLLVNKMIPIYLYHRLQI